MNPIHARNWTKRQTLAITRHFTFEFRNKTLIVVCLTIQTEVTRKQFIHYFP